MKILTIEPGTYVCCDMCSRDFTNSDETGGILFESKGVGPCCSARIEKSALKYNEAQHIRARCPINMSFAHWIREVIR